MRRFRQWLAETQDHMTESPDGDWALYTEALAAIEAAVKAREKELEVELSNLALAHEADRKPLVDELIKEQKYILKLEAAVKEKDEQISFWRNNGTVQGLEKQREQIAALTESRDEWKRQWRLMEAAEKKAEEQIAALQEETSRLYAVTVEQSRQIAALNDALSGRDNVIERLKGYLVNKKTDIAEKVEYIATLAAENKRLLLIVTLMCRDEDHRGYFLSDLDIGRENIDIGWIKAILDQDALKQGKEAGG